MHCHFPSWDFFSEDFHNFVKMKRGLCGKPLQYNCHWGHVFTVESFYDAVGHGPSSWFIRSVCLVSS